MWVTVWFKGVEKGCGLAKRWRAVQGSTVVDGCRAVKMCGAVVIKVCRAGKTVCGAPRGCGSVKI